MMSVDYGQTFAPVSLPTSASYTAFGEGASGNNAFGARNGEFHAGVIGEDDKFYVMYFTRRPNVSGSTDRYQLNLCVMDVNGVQAHHVVETISSSSTSFGNNGYINIISTSSDIVAVVRPGRVFTPRGGTAAYQNVSMALVYDFATHAISKINFGGSAYVNGNFSSGLSSGSDLMLATDGDNVFMLNGGPTTPSGKVPLRLREFTRTGANHATYFFNTETYEPLYSPGWEPYMDLERAEMDYGVYDTPFVGEPTAPGNGGVVHDFTVKRCVGGVSGHSADLYFLSTSDIAGGVSSVRRMRVVNPNSQMAMLVEDALEDFPASMLASMFGLPVSNFTISRLVGSRCHSAVEGAVLSSFLYTVWIPGAPPIEFFVLDKS